MNSSSRRPRNKRFSGVVNVGFSETQDKRSGHRRFVKINELSRYFEKLVGGGHICINKYLILVYLMYRL